MRCEVKRLSLPLVALALAMLLGPGRRATAPAPERAEPAAAQRADATGQAAPSDASGQGGQAGRSVQAKGPVTREGGPGFRSRRSFLEHYEKHGSEFGNISAEEYLERAKALRNAEAGGPILEIVRDDGVITRFDKRNGYFGAYNRDGTIRTFFVPNDGVRYFERQARRRPQ